MDVLSHIKLIVALMYFAFIAINIILVIHDKRDPVKALSWIIVMMTLPIIGLIFYLIFGRNHRKQKLFSRKELTDLKTIENITTRQVYGLSSNQLKQTESVSINRDIITLLLNSCKAPLTIKNSIETFNNGKDTFDSIIEAIKGAKHFIHLEYYIFDYKDAIGMQISELLIEKAKEGVEVRMIYDDVGSWSIGPRFCNKMRKAGVQIKGFMPVVFPWLTSNVNYRNHRKILVVDGTVAFTGGVNIADRYISGGEFGFWRDAHIKIQGQAAQMLQLIFSTDWYFVSGEILNNVEKYLPEHKVEKELAVHIATSGPDSDWASIMQAYFAAINKAKKHIYISTPYFLPNQAILTALKVAALSGIDVRIMMPKRSDSKVVLWASRSYISELLEAGIKIFLFEKGFIHSKIVIIDGTFASIGSANMDIRSFEDNFEVSAFIFDEQFTQEFEKQFIADLDFCQQVSAESWHSRAPYLSILESISRLFSPLL
ncbi:MAG: cardiolipin synthase [Rikenellaceae bacterium]